MKSLIVSLTIFWCVKISGQTLYDKVWVQGSGVSFSTTFTGTAVVNSYLDTTFSPYFEQGSNICDKYGSLILCSNGYHIYNNQTSILDNGSNIVPNEIIAKYTFSPFSQSSIFLPFSNNKYYLITPTASDTNILNNWGPSSTYAPFDLMLYNIVDMNANGGQGKVVKKAIPFLQSAQLSKVGMMACKHGNGKDWWLFKQGIMSNTIYKFLVTEDSIYNYGIQYFPAPLFNQFDQNGQMMFSQDGSKYASTIRGNHSLFVADFDRCNGVLSNPKVFYVSLSSCHNIYDTTCYENCTEGLCFSPNGRYLYVSTCYNIKQLDLWDSDTNSQWSHIWGLDTAWDYCNGYSSMYLGPDNRIYVGHWNGLGDAMSVINNPDLKGGACSFCPLCCKFPNFGSTNPPCMPNYHLGAAPVGGNCWPVDVQNSIKPHDDLLLSPNPVSTTLRIESASLKHEDNEIALIDLTGRVCFAEKRNASDGVINIDTRNLLLGMYLLKINGVVKKVLKE